MKYPTSRLTPFPPTFPGKCIRARTKSRENSARAPAVRLSTFRMNTCKSVSKQRTLSPSRMNTCEKTGGGASPGPLFLSHTQLSTVDPRPFSAGIMASCHALFARPLFSWSYELLLPQPLSFHNNLRCPPGEGCNSQLEPPSLRHLSELCVSALSFRPTYPEQERRLGYNR